MANQKTVEYNRIIIAACFSIQAIGIGIYISYGVFFNPLMDEFGWPRAVISGASSAAFFIMGLFGILIGRLNDKFGPRILMSIAGIFYGLGFCLMSQINSVFALYIVFGIIFGIGLSCVDVIALSTIARWFENNRGKVTGLVKVGTGAGQFTFPIAASILIANFGWKNAFIAMGIFASVFLVCIAQFLKRDPEQALRSSNTGIKKINHDQNSGLPFSKALKTSRMWVICFVNFLVVFCLMCVLVHIVPHARDIGISPHKAAGVLSTIGVVSMLGRFLSGLAIDRIGSKMIMNICFGLLILSLFWLIQADTLWRLYCFSLVYGFAHGGFFTAISPIVAELFGIRAHGSIFGIVVFFGTTGGALGPISMGFLFDLYQNYTAAFQLILVVSCAALVLMCFLKPENPSCRSE